MNRNFDFTKTYGTNTIRPGTRTTNHSFGGGIITFQYLAKSKFFHEKRGSFPVGGWGLVGGGGGEIVMEIIKYEVLEMSAGGGDENQGAQIVKNLELLPRTVETSGEHLGVECRFFNTFFLQPTSV